MPNDACNNRSSVDNNGLSKSMPEVKRKFVIPIKIGKNNFPAFMARKHLSLI
jgi:hypothetical protein